MDIYGHLYPEEHLEAARRMESDIFYGVFTGEKLKVIKQAREINS
jgi:hypothetical protein